MVKLIDSSIRDGGNVNNWYFGKRVIDGIIKNLVDSKMDIIELGYLRNDVYSKDRSVYNTVSEAMNNLPADVGKSEFSLMVQEDKWDWDNLEPCNGIIKHIRVSFHKTDIDEGLLLCEKVKLYGYVCHCNPINIMGYSDEELTILIDRINNVKPDFFTLVDTFGSMNISDMKRIENLVHNNLERGTAVAVHLHENLGLAYSLAQEAISFFEEKRDFWVDASLFGIGRIPGNLCQELIMNYLIEEYNADYDIDPVYDAIDDFITMIKKANPWGYDLAYALSATYNLHRTYAEYLLKKGKLRTKDIKAILESIDDSEKVIYNEQYIEELYFKYIDLDADDSFTKIELEKKLSGESILILAPGKSIVDELNEINEYIFLNRCVIISVNFDGNTTTPDLYFYTNPKRFLYDKDKIDDDSTIITSNLLRESANAKYILNFKRLSNHFGNYNEDSVLMLVKLLIQIGAKKIAIAGFDGFRGEYEHFDSSLDNNYYSKYNYKKVKEIVDKYSSKIDITYITKSVYEKNE